MSRKFFFIHKGFFIASILLGGVLVFPEIVFALAGDARMNYGQGVSATPQTRFYTNSLNTFGAAGATVAGTANVGWVVSKESPTEDVTVMATQSTTGMLDVYCRNGSTWTKDWSVSVGPSAATQRFDLEFEKTSGIPMVLYSRNVAGANELAFRRKTSFACGAAAWTAATNLNSARLTGIALWIEMEARQTAGTNVLAAAFSDSSAVQGGRLSSFIWNGTTWGNEPGAAHDTSLELLGGAGANEAKVFDLAFESLSGDLILGWGNSAGNNGTNGFRYATCTATLPCAWSGAITPAGLSDDATNIAAAADPGSDAVAFVSIGDAGSDLQAWRWTGAAVGAVSANADTSTRGPATGLMLTGIDWVVSGAQRMAVATYADNPNGYRYIYYDTVGNAWRTNTNNGFAVPGTPGTQGRHLQVTTNPINTAQVMFSFVDNANDLWSKRLAYNGAGGGGATPLATWSNADGGVALEANVSSTNSKSFWLDWVRVSAPSITTYTNSTEVGLNYAAACTTCGARIGGGAGFRQTIVITGTNFGADPGVANRSTATHNIRIGTQQIANANVTAWSPTSITILTDTAVAGDTDTDWGAEYGGASALTVTAGSLTSTGVNFYVFPQVTSVTQPAGLPADTAREYNALDTDGVVTLNGTRFGTAQGTGYVRILGCDSATCVAPPGSVAVNSWSTTAIQVQVPVVIADNVYTGSILMAQGTGGNGKTHTYGNTFRILPRITSFTPVSGSVGDAVVVNGNHFCENAGVCPVAFNASNKVTFTSAVDATIFTSWTNTAMTTEVPTGGATGAVVLKSNAYDSNGLSFTVVSSLPDDPTALNQFQNAGLTQAIAVGGGASSTPVYFTMTMQAPAPAGTLFPQIEYKPIGTGFTCGAGVCVTAIEGAGVAGPGPVDCAVVGNACAVAISPADDIYHWRARVRRNKSGSDYFSNWVSFPTSGNAETITDIAIDTIAPVITNINGGIPGTNSTTVTWDTSGEVSTSQVQYNLTGTFVDDCAVNNDCTTLDPALVLSHSVPIANLNSGATYFFRVRSKDMAGNETISANNTFVTSSVTQPAKTVRFHAGTFANGVVLGGSATSTTFTVTIPEVATTTKSAFLVLRAIYSTTGSAPNGIAIQINSEPSVTYQLPGVSSTGNIRLVHPVAQLRVGTATNTISVSPETNTSLNIISSNVFATYSYTP